MAVDPAAGSVTIESDAGEHTYRVTDATYIWLDRSERGETTMEATLPELEDLAGAGLVAEARALGPERPHTAAWLKVRLAPEG